MKVNVIFRYQKRIDMLLIIIVEYLVMNQYQIQLFENQYPHPIIQVHGIFESQLMSDRNLREREKENILSLNVFLKIDAEKINVTISIL